MRLLFIGKIELFDELIEIWDVYMECVDFYFRVNGVLVDLLVFLFLVVIGVKMYGLLKNIVVLNKFVDFIYE